MREKLRFLGFGCPCRNDSCAVAEADGEVRSLGTIVNREESIRKFIRKLGPPEHLRACYEAGPTGFVLYWQLTQLGVECDVVAPSLVPKKPGDRVKTDRRDALKLARSHRSDDLTAVWVPDESSEALRDLVRRGRQLSRISCEARHRLTKFLLRTGQRPPLGVKAWTERYVEWVQQVRYTHPAREATLLDCLNEVQHMDETSEAVGRVDCRSDSAGSRADAGSGSRLAGIARHCAYLGSHDCCRAGQHLFTIRKCTGADGYSGVFPSEDSSGERVRRGGITKSGNAHLRRIVVESAWSYRHRPAIGARYANARKGFRQRSPRLRGKRRTACTSAT